MLERFTWEGTANVAAGSIDTNYVQTVTSMYGKPGTIFFGYVRDRPKGGLLIVR